MPLLHQMPPPTSGYDPYCIAEEALSDYDIRDIPGTVVEAWYWYATAPYEGEGFILAKHEDGGWSVADMSHCSCYGPTDRIDAASTYPTLDAIKDGGTPEWYAGFAHLVEAAKEAQ